MDDAIRSNAPQHERAVIDPDGAVGADVECDRIELRLCSWTAVTASRRQIVVETQLSVSGNGRDDPGRSRCV